MGYWIEAIHTLSFDHMAGPKLAIVHLDHGPPRQLWLGRFGAVTFPSL